MVLDIPLVILVTNPKHSTVLTATKKMNSQADPVHLSRAPGCSQGTVKWRVYHKLFRLTFAFSASDSEMLL